MTVALNAPAAAVHTEPDCEHCDVDSDDRLHLWHCEADRCAAKWHEERILVLCPTCRRLPAGPDKFGDDSGPTKPSGDGVPRNYRPLIEQCIVAAEDRVVSLRAYLQTRVELADWHGVADAAMDLRDETVRLEALREVLG